MPSPTISEVAKQAGVSRATVSRVVNNNPRVDPALRMRVLATIEALGYQPNRSARRLRAQSSSVIGLVISDIQNPYFISVIRGVEDASYAAEMSIILCNSDEDYAKQRMHLRVLEGERVAGLIIVPARSDEGEDLARLQNAGIPVILLDRAIESIPVDTVGVDNARGAYDAVKHLIGLGCRRIAMISGPMTLTTGTERFRGYRDAHQDAGLAVEEALVKVGDFRAESGYRLAKELLAAQPPDAIFVANNLMTLGVMHYLREAGVRVPEGMPLVGFDDMPWSAELYSPLTAVSQPTYELGQEAVALLLRRIANANAPFRSVVLQTKLIVRESCGAKLRQAERMAKDGSAPATTAAARPSPIDVLQRARHVTRSPFRKRRRDER
ncbi:MAG: LacI family DNA-binding transcriptional regulator [Anaerolineae bacterium]|nr:LacI family DNA-binding transcriptional regulator [Anaerolineae bacterium]